ncbi:phosphodiester glycosidase family protein [Oscillatoria sp. FACHB-1406]|uniref:phosphodiester glycosidase family protein n=1 Tax=Oscillatoria sp. FACHB-1406 TaxID=2692846 RepID=UPI0018EF9D58
MLKIFPRFSLVLVFIFGILAVFAFKFLPKSLLNFSTSPCLGEDPNFSIQLLRSDNQGLESKRGDNYAILLNPRSPRLDFKVNVGLSHPIYAKDGAGKFRRDYTPKTFREIIADENAQLNGELPFAAINADYIDTENKPQGLNISRGVEYAGAFKNKRSSFGISGGEPSQRRATIQVGKRNEERLNYNLVGGNGRFYQDGTFKDICQALGEFACQQATTRSMAAITDKNYVIFLVNNYQPSIFSTNTDRALYPDSFNRVLEGIAGKHCLGNIQEGLLFDGGISPGLYYDGKVLAENRGPIGSVFLIYNQKN